MDLARRSLFAPDFSSEFALAYPPRFSVPGIDAQHPAWPSRCRERSGPVHYRPGDADEPDPFPALGRRTGLALFEPGGKAFPDRRLDLPLSPRHVHCPKGKELLSRARLSAALRG